MKINIIDNLFAHAPSSSWYNHPKKFSWERRVDENLTIITDDDLSKVNEINCEKKIGWVVESRLIRPSSYDYVKNNHQNFFKIFTHDSELLKISNKFEFLHVGGCWIEKEDRKIHKKNKKISTIVSKKYGSEGYDLRHKIVEDVPNIDVFGNGYNEIPNKIFGLKDYQYSIVVENCRSDFYFTEKIIDCFITGTVPIYWGCPSINKFFDGNGIIIFEDISDLKNKIDNLGDFYEKNKYSIFKNFYLSLKYLIAEDKLFEILKKNKLLNI